MNTSTFVSGEDPPKRRHKKKRQDGKPKRHMSAYNFFFRDERQALLRPIHQQRDSNHLELQSPSIEGYDRNNTISTSISHSSSQASADSKQHLTGKQESNSTTISFQTITKIIGERWKNMSDEVKLKYKLMADRDSERYAQEMKIYEDAKRRARDALDNSIDSHDVSSRENMMRSRNMTHNMTSSITPISTMNMNLFGRVAPSSYSTITRADPFSMYTYPTQPNSTTSTIGRITTGSTWIENSRQHHHHPLPFTNSEYQNNHTMIQLDTNNILARTFFPVMLQQQSQQQDTIQNTIAGNVPGMSMSRINGNSSGRTTTSTNTSNNTATIPPLQELMKKAVFANQHQQQHYLQGIHGENDESVYQNILNDPRQIVQILSVIPQNDEERQSLLLQLHQLYHVSKTNELKLECLLFHAIMMMNAQS